MQGVGFRPFVWRLACAHGLSGWVRNGSNGVLIEVQGTPEEIDAFVRGLETEHPPQALVRELAREEIPARSSEPSPGDPGDPTGPAFEIQASVVEATSRPAIPADLAICRECAAEIADPREPRFRYPFTNCTQCGPRFTLIASLPYDRPRTAMAGFTLCPDCQAQYRDPGDRRFHAQPIACPACGPRLQLVSASGTSLAEGDRALAEAARAIAAGQILALKGLGGFQLLVDASSEAAVRLLRVRKNRPAKPFAVMAPDLAALEPVLALTDPEREALAGVQAPILLVRRQTARLAERGEGPVSIAASVAPDNPYLGVMLPYTPLHRLLLAELGRPVVCTSGNLSDEPMCIDDAEAMDRLGAIADLFLTHDRAVLRPVDDSVARLDGRQVVVVRRARGYAPLPHDLAELGPAVLALGGQQKATVALAVGAQVVVSQHLGDLDSPPGAALLERTARDLVAFVGTRPEILACDLHPDYTSTRLAQKLALEWGLPLVRVQHHHAHAAAVAAEYQETGRALALAWDGTGYGPDGTIWGGEALILEGPLESRARGVAQDQGMAATPELGAVAPGWRRLARLRPFCLPGGERAVREPRRAALGLLFEALGRDEAGRMGARWFGPLERSGLLQMLVRGTHSPWTSSMGRLFDAASALAGVRWEAGYEGQAAMAFEWAAGARVDPLGRASSPEPYPMPLIAGPGCAEMDWSPLVAAMLGDLAADVPASKISLRFHAALAEAAVQLADRADVEVVLLGGGCFQNRLLTQLVRDRLETAGYRVRMPARFPPNDGAISLGQALAARRAARGGLEGGFGMMDFVDVSASTPGTGLRGPLA